MSYKVLSQVCNSVESILVYHCECDVLLLLLLLLAFAHLSAVWSNIPLKRNRAILDSGITTILLLFGAFGV